MPLSIFMKSILERGRLYIMYTNYVLNQNENKDLNILKNTIIELIDTHRIEDSFFKFNSVKIKLLRNFNKYKYIYPNYAKYINDIILLLNIKNNEEFTQELKIKINLCDDLFILYLLFTNL